MNEKKALVPFFRRGDIGGISYVVTNNIVNYLIVIASLTFVLGWPNEIVFGHVVPAMSIGLMLGCFYYAWMGYKLSDIHEKAHTVLGVDRTVEPVMTLCFMSLAVIPEIKLTDMGLFDVTTFSFIPLEAE